MDAAPSSSNKRFRDDTEDSQEAKRLRADLLDILDDDDAGIRDPAIQDLASVMRSLEEEIGLPPPSPPQAYLDIPCQPDLGYLLEASDDELGLPPTESSSSGDEEVAVVAGEPEIGYGGEIEAAGFGQIWGFDDEIQSGFYDGMYFGLQGEERDAGHVFDCGIFDYGDEFCVSSDFSDDAWRPETLPAV